MTRVLLQVRILIKSGLWVREEVVLALLETYLEASILSLVGVNDVEAAVCLGAMLPTDVLVTRLWSAEQLVEEVWNL